MWAPPRILHDDTPDNTPGSARPSLYLPHATLMSRLRASCNGTLGYLVIRQLEGPDPGVFVGVEPREDQRGHGYNCDREHDSLM